MVWSICSSGGGEYMLRTQSTPLLCVCMNPWHYLMLVHNIHMHTSHTDIHARKVHPLSNGGLPHALFQHYHPILVKYSRSSILTQVGLIPSFRRRPNFCICCCGCCCVSFLSFILLFIHLFVCAHVHSSCKA